MTSQAVDIFSMLNKAQNEYNQQQSSVAAFFQQAQEHKSSNNNGAGNNNNRSMPVPIKGVSSLEQIEKQIRTSPPFYQNNVLQTGEQKDLANSPLAQFFNSNNLNNIVQRPAPPQQEVRVPREKQNGNKISAPPGFKSQPQQKNLLASKETKLITPVMFAPSNTNEKKISPVEPLTKNQLLQALNYLFQNDNEFMVKVHEAYIKSFKKSAS